MKRSVISFSTALWMSASAGWPLFAQAIPTPPPASPAPQTAPAKPSLQGRGPEAVAQQTPDKVVATIGGKEITAKQALDLLKPVDPNDRQRYDKNLPVLLQQIYLELQLADQATAMKLDTQDPWKEQLQMQRANVLTQAYLAKMAEGGAQDPKAYYDAHPADFDQIKLSGILVAFNPPGTPAGSSAVQRTESQAQEKANDLEKKLKAGGDFSALARTDSDNQQSSTRGGEIGTFTLGDNQVPAEVRAAVQNMQSGQVSEPVRVQGGYYIFKVDQRTKLPYNDQLSKSITQKMLNERKQIVLRQQLDKYKVLVQDEAFFNTSSAAAPSPALRVPSLQRPPATAPTPPPPPPSSKPVAPPQ